MPIPNIPGSPTVAVASTISIAVSWFAVPGATSYNLQYSIDGGNTFILVGSVTTPYPFAALATHIYCFQVQAVNLDGDSDWSDTSRLICSVQGAGNPEPCYFVTNYSGSQTMTVNFSTSDGSNYIILGQDGTFLGSGGASGTVSGSNCVQSHSGGGATKFPTIAVYPATTGANLTAMTAAPLHLSYVDVSNAVLSSISISGNESCTGLLLGLQTTCTNLTFNSFPYDFNAFPYTGDLNLSGWISLGSMTPGTINPTTLELNNVPWSSAKLEWVGFTNLVSVDFTNFGANFSPLAEFIFQNTLIESLVLDSFAARLGGPNTSDNANLVVVSAAGYGPGVSAYQSTFQADTCDGDPAGLVTFLNSLGTSNTTGATIDIHLNPGVGDPSVNAATIAACTQRNWIVLPAIFSWTGFAPAVQSSSGSSVAWASSGNLTGQNLAIAFVASGTAGSTVTDSDGNTWIALNLAANHSGVSGQIFYCMNPTVAWSFGTTVTATGVNPSIVVGGFMCPSTASMAFDTQSSAALASGTTIQPGSITPATNFELLVVGTAYASESDVPTIGPPWLNMNLEEAVATSTAHGISFTFSLYATPIPTAINPAFIQGVTDQLACCMALFTISTGVPAPNVPLPTTIYAVPFNNSSVFVPAPAALAFKEPGVWPVFWSDSVRRPN